MRLTQRSIHQELGFLPTTRFADGIKMTIQWYLENKGWLGKNLERRVSKLLRKNVWGFIMNKFKFISTPIADLTIVEPTVFGDHRGYFMETFSAREFKEAGLPTVFVQDNESHSKQGVVRGLHFQKKNPQGKLVRVIEGEVFDVGVDLRRNSPTFGKWFGVILSAENKIAILRARRLCSRVMPFERDGYFLFINALAYTTLQMKRTFVERS
jgi:hypothetical protein